MKLGDKVKGFRNAKGRMTPAPALKNGEEIVGTYPQGEVIRRCENFILVMFENAYIESFTPWQAKECLVRVQ